MVTSVQLFGHITTSTVKAKDVDKAKVSQNIQLFVRDTQRMNGNKKIDTQAEYNQLVNYLNQNAQAMNIDEKNYLLGFMKDYTDQEVKKNTTKNCRDLVDGAKKRSGDKKAIDNDVEANELVAMLRNTRGDLNAADIEYIKQTLIESGYGHLIPDEAVKNNEVDKDNKKEDVSDGKETDKTDKLGETQPAPQEAENAEKAGKQNSPENNTTQPSKPGKTQPKKPGKTNPAKPGKTQPTKPGKTQPAKPGKTQPKKPAAPKDDDPLSKIIKNLPGIIGIPFIGNGPIKKFGKPGAKAVNNVFNQ